MKMMPLVLFLFASVCLAAERPFDSGLSESITITEANYLLDGGSVIVSLRDAHGRRAGARYFQTLFEDPHNGQLGFRAPGATKLKYLDKDSADEQALLQLLVGACTHTFGTADPRVLRRTAKATERRTTDWNRFAMASLFNQVGNRSRMKTPKHNHK
jgi:hypothetical protein